MELFLIFKLVKAQYSGHKCNDQSVSTLYNRVPNTLIISYPSMSWRQSRGNKRMRKWSGELTVNNIYTAIGSCLRREGQASHFNKPILQVIRTPIHFCRTVDGGILLFNAAHQRRRWSLVGFVFALFLCHLNLGLVISSSGRCADRCSNPTCDITSAQRKASAPPFGLKAKHLYFEKPFAVNVKTHAILFRWETFLKL